MMKRVLLVSLFLLVPCAAFAQPFNAWLVVSPGYPTNHGYIQLPSSSAFNFAGGSFTFEAWIVKDSATDCRSFAGNGYLSSQWIGVCGNVLRSYVSGGGSFWDAGAIRPNKWTHIAVTFDAATHTRRHYVDGELAGEHSDTAITVSPNAWRIFSDFDYERSPSGSIDEVRLWNVARTLEQIRSTITSTITTPQTGLVSVYPLDGSANDVVGGRNGTRTGAGGFLNPPIGPAGCTTTASSLCVGPSGRFQISGTWQTDSSNGNASVVTALTTSESGIFWFFAPTNWEVVVKVLNGCGVNNRWWVFTGGLTNQHYELAVTDYKTGETKRYFNYQGVIAPQVQDVNAFANCP